MKRLVHLALALGLAVHLTPAVAAPDRQDVSAMSAQDILVLQRRLTDDGCYHGPLDGKPNMATDAAVAECPDQRPQLRIETGMHVAVIRGIDVDGDCTIAATASEDKTVRLWSLPEGNLLRTLRWPIGAGNYGKAFATAVSPDGQYVAVGGYDANYEVTGTDAVTIFDAATGSVIAGAGSFENGVGQLAFSEDGHWLAATLGSGGVRMIDASTWREVAADKKYSGDSYGAVFGPDGRLYTTSYDGKLRRYAPGPAFTKEQEVQAQGGGQPLAIDIDPDGKRLIVGFEDTTNIDFYAAATLKFLGQAKTRDVDKGDLSSVAWRADGQRAAAGGRFHQSVGGAWKVPILLFARNGERTGDPIPLANNTILDLRSCGPGFVAATFDPAFGLLDGEGHKRFWREGVTANMRAKLGDAFTVSDDARSVRFGLGNRNAQPVLFDLTRSTLTELSGPGASVQGGALHPARTEGLSVSDWENNQHPKLDGQELALAQDETSRSLAVRPDADGFVLGTEWSLRAYDAKGRQKWQQDAPSDAWGVNLSADGRIVVAAYSDGTIRWHRWSDGRELLALFVNKQTKAWVAWTPSGYYSASPGGEDMIGWHVNRGWAQAAEFFPASRFHDQFARPDIVERVLDTLDEGEAVKQANAARGGKAMETGSILGHLPPVISIVSPADGAHAGDELRVDYSVRSPSGLAVDRVEALIDGQSVSTGRGLGRLDDKTAVQQCLTQMRGLGRTEGALQGCQGSITIALPPGTSEIGVLARAGDLSSEVAKIRVTRTVAASPQELLKPKLYAFVAGISVYDDHNYDLGFAAKDAKDFAAALQNQKGGLYSDVEVRLLTDGKANARNIREGLDWLTHEVTSRDVGVFYFAGHGKLDEAARFYILASDTDVTHLRSSAVPQNDITEALKVIPGKALLFLDTCHAGAVMAGLGQRGDLNMNEIVNDFSRAGNGVVIYASSTGRQVSQENPAWNNGAFTKALVEGLGMPGVKAIAALGDDKITTSGLDRYVTERVKKLTGGAQSPVMQRPGTVPDFPLAVAR